MKSILSQLYYGNLAPMEQCFPKNKEHKKACQKHCQHYETFSEKLGALDFSLQKEFTDIIDEQVSTACLELEESFIYGFQLGARMMVELYQDN
ncbi:MAG: DUF6809 family protein [Oscillospiraceae bacterium]|jgi:hypothetical protein